MTGAEQPARAADATRRMDAQRDMVASLSWTGYAGKRAGDE
jgi:hypothetical protein